MSVTKGSTIPNGQQWIEEDDIQAVIDALKSEYLTTGPAASDVIVGPPGIEDKHVGKTRAIVFQGGSHL